MKDIPGFEGLYSITEAGEVYSLDKIVKCRAGKTRKVKGIIRKIRISDVGYPIICLSKNDIVYVSTIHRLVARTYIPNPENLPMVNHKNGVKTDNRVENLEWCDATHNMRHAFANLPRNIAVGARNGKSKGVIDLQTGVYYDMVKEAQAAKNISAYRFRGLMKKGALEMAYV